jgi:uncharacterized protein (TIGR00255 family)
MTGYGQARWQGSGCSIFAEVRSVNGRHLKVKSRLPHELSPAEQEIEKLVREHISRGTVEVYVKVERTGAEAARPINQEALLNYVRQIQAASEALGQELPFHADRLLDLPGVLEGEEAAFEDYERVLANVKDAVERALQALDRMRLAEGANLRQELVAHCAALEEGMAGVEEAQPEAIEAYQERLVVRVNRMLQDTGVDVTERDLAREVAIFAERSDISEELSRLRSHVEQFREMLEQEKPVGRRLEFLGQEMHREVNTLGAKVSDATLSKLVGPLRVAVDKVREQVLNVE